MKTLIKSSQKLTKVLQVLEKETGWKPYNIDIDYIGTIRLQGNYSEEICKYLSDNGYERKDNYFTEYHNGNGVEIILTK